MVLQMLIRTDVFVTDKVCWKTINTQKESYIDFLNNINYIIYKKTLFWSNMFVYSY